MNGFKTLWQFVVFLTTVAWVVGIGGAVYFYSEANDYKKSCAKMDAEMSSRPIADLDKRCRELMHEKDFVFTDLHLKDENSNEYDEIIYGNASFGLCVKMDYCSFIEKEEAWFKLVVTGPFDESPYSTVFSFPIKRSYDDSEIFTGEDVITLPSYFYLNSGYYRVRIYRGDELLISKRFRLHSR